VRKLVKVPEPVKVPVPATYATLNKQVMVQPEHAEWVQVLCDVNATPKKIKEVEQSLNSKGYSIREDGQIDQELTDSIRDFQKQNGLHVTGLMTAETLSKLGIEVEEPTPAAQSSR
jgi:peptidoglycan hydrolase-like protein with peptidoglycan-binding domain